VILPFKVEKWPSEAKFELEERIAVSAEGCGEDPQNPSQAVVEQAIRDLRERWKREDD
jgi:hypothetical protein